jgi:hypothetical protein
MAILTRIAKPLFRIHGVAEYRRRPQLTAVRRSQKVHVAGQKKMVRQMAAEGSRKGEVACGRAFLVTHAPKHARREGNCPRSNMQSGYNHRMRHC